MAIELELKFRADATALAAIEAAFPEKAHRLQMETVYYDTPDAALSKQHYTLRKRQENDVHICTLKTPAGSQGRNEWETECNHIEDAIPILCKLSGSEELLTLTRSGIISICGAKFTRIAKALTIPGAVVELALDQGVLLGGSKELPFWEAEIELKSGSPKALMAFGQDFAKKFGLQTEPKSKFRRALDLTKGD